MNTTRKIIRGSCAYKPGISVHLLVSIDRYQLLSIACDNGLTMKGFNTISVEAEGQCKWS